MKRLLSIATIIGLAALPAWRSAAAPGAGPEALVEAERAFAQAADAGTVRDAFLAYLAPTAVVFQNGPVNARKLYQSLKPGHARLAWQPAFAVMSGAGDLGWTTGPWQWRRDSSRTAPDATGEYTTLWRRQPDGTLKAVLDMGIEHDAPPAGTPVPVPVLRTLSGTRTTRGPLAARGVMWKADADYARVAATQGHAAAFAAVATADARLLRQGAFPVIGREPVRDTLAAHPGTEHFMSTAQFIADSGDLGYTYGTLIARSAAGADSSYYLHIWQREGARPWQLAFELVKPARD